MRNKIGLGMFIVMLLMVLSMLYNPVYASDVIETESTGIGTQEAGSTDIVVTSDPIQLKVTLPIRLTVHLEETGEVITSEEYYIQNLSAAGGIEVVDIQLKTKNSWVLEDFTYEEYKNLPVNSKIYGFQIFSDNADPETGSIPLNSPEWTVIPSAGMVAEDDGLGNITYRDNVESMINRLYLRYDAKLGAQSQAVPETAIGGIIFTVDFDYAE